jgi:hypothetical protein
MRVIVFLLAHNGDSKFEMKGTLYLRLPQHLSVQGKAIKRSHKMNYCHISLIDRGPRRLGEHTTFNEHEMPTWRDEKYNVDI